MKIGALHRTEPWKADSGYSRVRERMDTSRRVLQTQTAKLGKQNCRAVLRHIRIFYKKGTADAAWTQVTGWNFSKDDKNGSLSFSFKETVEARYIKVVTDWDDRNTDNESIENYATFKGTPRNMLRVWTLSSNLAETYGYDTAGNRVSLTTWDTGGSSSYTYTYYANTNNGNSTRVLYDGRWYYTYDANGNRTARGKSATVSGNNVVIDTTAEYWTYTWDLHNRLSAVKQYNAPDSRTCADVSYTYDALNYRIERTGSDGTTVYAYGRSGALTYVCSKLKLKRIAK
jgi:uncharacterized protein RhaS with RHS repeats